MKPVPGYQGTKHDPLTLSSALLPTPTSLLSNFFPSFETESHTFKAGLALTREPSMTLNS